METNPEKICLIVGSGAVANSWNPILKVLQPDYNFSLDADSANTFLAGFIYHLRFMAVRKEKEGQEQLQKILHDFNSIKHRICYELNLSQQNKNIFPQKEFSQILDKFIFQKNVEFTLISTNWDFVIDNSINEYGRSIESADGRINTFHLHGDISNFRHLYMPSEIVSEAYRIKEDEITMRRNHTIVMRTLASSNKTILYGLSLDPLDAELLQILGLGWNSQNQKEIIIINPDHSKVAKRVKIVLNDFDRSINIYAFSPYDLSKKIQY